MISPKIDLKEVSWIYQNRRISPKEVYEAKDVTFDTINNKVLVLCGERGVSTDLLVFDELGNLEFSLGSPMGHFQYFRFNSKGVGVMCGDDLNSDNKRCLA